MNGNSRFRLSELSGERIIGGVMRRLLQVRSIATWNYSARAKSNRQRLAAYHNRFAGKRCFIIANGPSLTKMDLSPLRNEITFGMNRFYLLFEQLGFETSFYVAVNDLVIKQYHQDINKLQMPKFLNWDYQHLFPEREDFLFFKTNMAFQDRFSKMMLQPVSSGGTVTYVTLQLAFFLGFQEVILIGLDHNYVSKGVPNTVRIRETKEDQDHVHPDYFPKGIKWQIPDLRRSELAYELARKAFEGEGRSVVDATVDGKCMVFEKATFSSLFK